jgi:hypothetical protein
MNLQDFLPLDPGVLPPIPQENVDRLWSQARQELANLAQFLTNNNAVITAAQLTMALALADEAVAKRQGKSE